LLKIILDFYYRLRLNKALINPFPKIVLVCNKHTGKVIEMSTKARMELLLQEKEERVSNWERYGVSTGLLDRSYCEMPKVENWHI
jgi:hypothetical protein